MQTGTCARDPDHAKAVVVGWWLDRACEVPNQQGNKNLLAPAVR